ncbi:MAG: GNAT family N-acetyltransferase [Treponema bryantii]|nr:GNAT family N-acetyltransferase [Treponema bryantii]
MKIKIREIIQDDLEDLLKLYEQLGPNPFVQVDEHILTVWNNILQNKDYHIVVAEVEGKIVSTCTCVIISNLTHNQRPYAVVENVVTDQNFRGKGYATSCLDFAKEIAIKNNCYKLMLMTGSKKETTLNFYRNAGYTDKTKTAFDQRV